jgi:hypothetical protein
MQRLCFKNKLWGCKFEALPRYVLHRVRLELPFLHRPRHRSAWVGDPNRAHVAEVDGLYGKRELCWRHDLRSSGESSLSHMVILLDTNPPRFLSDGWSLRVTNGARAIRYSMCWWLSRRCCICVDSGRLLTLFVLRRGLKRGLIRGIHGFRVQPDTESICGKMGLVQSHLGIMDSKY